MKLLPLIQANAKTVMALTIAVLLILFFLRPCNKSSDEKLAQLKAENAALKIEKTKAVNEIIEQRARYRSDSAEWRGREQLALVEKKEAEKNVKAAQSTINRLTLTIRDRGGISLDSINSILVSRGYKAACDSLPGEIDKLNYALLEKDSAIDVWSGVLAYEIQLRDSAIEAEQKHSATLSDLYNRQVRVTDEAINRARPRGRLLGGVGLIGNETNPLGGTKINIAYQSKGGKQYQVGGMLFKGGVWYEATVLVTLIK